MSKFEVDPKDLKPNPWNSNIVSPDNQAKLDESVKRNGLFKPILVRTLDDGTLEILGGQHRWEAAVRLRISPVPIWNLGAIDDKKAKEISLLDNGRYGSDDAIALAELLEDIGSIEDIATFMPYTEAELTAITSSVDIAIDELGSSDPDDDDTPSPSTKATKTHTMMRFKVPVDDAERLGELFEKIMKRQGFSESDALTNAGDALVWAINQTEKAGVL